jgi:hypothetical protein
MTREELAAMSNDELFDFMCGTFDWNNPKAPDFPESMALVAAELLRRAQKRQCTRVWLPGVLEDWVGRHVPPSVPQLGPLLAWAKRAGLN